jgi:hypothetical protein
MIRTLLVLAAVLYIMQQTAAAQDVARLHLSVMSVTGEPVESKILLIDLDAADDVSKNLRGSGPFLVRPARYLIRVEAPGFARREEVVDVVGNEMFVRIGLNPARLSDLPRNEIRGRIIAADGRPVRAWIKLVPIMNNERWSEVPIASDGAFSFADIASGFYVALVVSTDRLLQAQQVYCCSRPATELVIRVPSVN